MALLIFSSTSRLRNKPEAVAEPDPAPEPVVPAAVPVVVLEPASLYLLTLGMAY